MGYGGFPKLGLPFGGSHNMDYSILGSILGSLILGNYHILLGLYRDNEKENGNYCLGFRV